uniref:Uncharacterized protein n=1 Tax=Cryptomonas curvata TaxID=233186 RepID=A0A7S0M9K8_9CRYP|mmetsp:Transcript_27581/g.57350  ORF Transcript_27581/g.57350 Transcript_27581/m.57350 type:complete len:125 (+) Transcript_27581:72-446(+)
MSGMFWNTMMCSDKQCTQVLFVAEFVGFLGIPLIIGLWCCCNWSKWQKIEDERERKREALISKTRVCVDPVDRVQYTYGTIQPLELEQGRERRPPPGSSVIDSAIQLHRSGELGGDNLRNVPDF